MNLREKIEDEISNLLMSYPDEKIKSIYVDEFNYKNLKDKKIDNITIQKNDNLVKQTCIIYMNNVSHGFSTTGHLF